MFHVHCTKRVWCVTPGAIYFILTRSYVALDWISKTYHMEICCMGAKVHWQLATHVLQFIAHIDVQRPQLGCAEGGKLSSIRTQAANPGVDGGLLRNSQRCTARHKPLHPWPYGAAASRVRRAHNGRVDGEMDLIHSREWYPPSCDNESPQQCTPLGQGVKHNNERGCISEQSPSSTHYPHLTIHNYPWFRHLEHYCCQVFNWPLSSSYFAHHRGDILGLQWYWGVS